MSAVKTVVVCAALIVVAVPLATFFVGLSVGGGIRLALWLHDAVEELSASIDVKRAMRKATGVYRPEERPQPKSQAG